MRKDGNSILFSRLNCRGKVSCLIQLSAIARLTITNRHSSALEELGSHSQACLVRDSFPIKLGQPGKISSADCKKKGVTQLLGLIFSTP